MWYIAVVGNIAGFEQRGSASGHAPGGQQTRDTGNGMKENEKALCRRCGECCRRSTPALHVEDIKRVGRILLREHLVTLRAGETVFDNVAGAPTILAHELVKVRSRPGEAVCLLFSPSEGCRVYGDRPEECRVLFCEKPEALEGMYRHRRIGRQDLLADRPDLARAAALQEERCSQARVPELCRRAREKNPAAVEQLLSMAATDMGLRKVLLSKGMVREAELAFLLGRPFSETLAPFGLRVREQGSDLALESFPGP